jgi:hypothetical protein
MQGRAEPGSKQSRMEDAGGIAPPETPSKDLPRHLAAVGSTQETHDVTTFDFSMWEEPFAWRAGQFLGKDLPGTQEPRGPTRLSSITSSPFEAWILTMFGSAE